jgi:polar amino acid transport system permease protein/cystine transport system permease protein
VAAPEIMFRARQLTTETFQSGQIYLLAALLYLALSLPLSQVVRRLERRASVWH